MLENNGCTISSNLLTELSGKENAMLSYFAFAKVYFRQHFWNENSKISMFNWYFILELGGSETVWK